MKKNSYTLITGLLDLAIVVVFSLFAAVIFNIICGNIAQNPQKPLSEEDNQQLNKTEQYQRSQGRKVLFIEDIFNY